jgi:hypothetical protein
VFYTGELRAPLLAMQLGLVPSIDGIWITIYLLDPNLNNIFKIWITIGLLGFKWITIGLLGFKWLTVGY